MSVHGEQDLSDRLVGVQQPVSLGGVELINAIRSRKLYAYVLALPVSTEIARIRGLNGYQLPKWRADISVDLGHLAPPHLPACRKCAHESPAARRHEPRSPHSSGSSIGCLS